MPIIKLNSSDNTTQIQFKTDQINSTIFDCFEKEGIKLPHGCLAGSCGACRIEIIEGSENLSTPSPVEAETINHIKKNQITDPAKQIRLSCRAKIKGNITIAQL